MGWLPSFLGGDKSSDSIDPKLREFLDKEAPVKYTPSQPPHPQTPPPSAAPSIPPPEESRPKALVPPESLYQDGRYAHLWKNYRPLAQIEAETMTEHDKMTEVLETFKSRKADVQRAAMENCSLQQEEWTNCMKNGSWEDQLQMCRHQVQKFERCYNMQIRFLRALGYGSTLGRPADVEDDIQLHADALFQRMVAYEAEAKAAKEAGRSVPEYDPAIPGVSKNAPQPTAETQKAWRLALEKLSPEERKVEEAALRADLQDKADVAARVMQIREDEKMKREASGQPSFGDFISGLMGFGKGK